MCVVKRNNMTTIKNMFFSYFQGVFYSIDGESYISIIRYFIPEFITNLILYSLPLWIDTFFIGQLSSTHTYATLGVTNNIIHFIIKIAEAISVGTVVMSGQFNGKCAYKKVGQAMRDAFWLTCIFGIIF